MTAQSSSARDNTELCERLGVHIDPGTLRLALTHRSYAYEHGGLPTNERLEFLGDSVLGFAVTGALYERHPDLAEGALAKWRAAVVSTVALAERARSLGVGEFILLGQGEILSNGKDKASILADTMEALIGAIYISNDIETASAFVLRLVEHWLDDEESLVAARDYKTQIQEYAATAGLGPARYDVVGEGPDHARRYVATLLIGERSYGSGEGNSKKVAEKEAARASWQLIEAERQSAAEAPSKAKSTAKRSDA